MPAYTRVYAVKGRPIRRARPKPIHLLIPGERGHSIRCGATLTRARRVSEDQGRVTCKRCKHG